MFFVAIFDFEIRDIVEVVTYTICESLKSDEVLYYFTAISDGEVEPNHAILRECNSICHRLPILNTKSFQEQFFNVCVTLYLII